MSEVISVEGLVKTFQVGAVQVQALAGINLVIKRGEFVAIMGSSGSGKSTFMSIAGALEIASSGQCFINGRQINSLKPDQLAEVRNKDIGFVFQSFNLLPRLNVSENISLPLLYNRVPLAERQARALAAAQLVGLSQRLSHLPAELSGGEKQRVAIARALINEPAIIFADEPTGNLDSKTGEEIMRIFSQLNQRGVTIVLVTHDPVIAQYARRVIYFRDGQIYRQEMEGENKNAN